MHRTIRVVVCVGFLILLWLVENIASAQTLTVLASFNGNNGETPQAGLTLIGNNLYGTTEFGGANGDGTVFSLPVSGGSPTVLASFNGSNGANPYAGLTVSGNTLYGTTTTGGANQYGGTVFSVPLSGGSPTVLASFNGSNGWSPYAGLTLIGNTLYGTTTTGGGYGGWNDGVVFSLPVSGGSPTVLVTFTGERRRKSICRFDSQRQHPLWDGRKWWCQWVWRHGLQRFHNGRPDGAGPVQRQQRWESLCRFDAQQ